MTRPTRRPATQATASAALSPLRVAVTVLAILAFAFQSYVTQTHIHMSGRSLSGLSLALNTAKSGPVSAPDKFPAKQDPSNCPICQEIVHGGSFVTPTAIAALPPALAISVIALRLDTAIAPQPASHSWRGRAPPHA